MDAVNSGSFNAAGGGTRADYLISLVAGKNVYRNQFKRYSKVSIESVMEQNPDIILIGTMSDNSILKSSIYDNKNFSIVNAVKRQGIYTIDLGYYLTFGTNTSNAVLGLMDIIYKSNYEDSK